MVTKEGKSSISRQNHEVVPVLKQGGTGTTIQNVFSTGTKHSGIGTTVSKSPDFFSFAYLSPKSYTDCIGTLLND